MFSTETSTAQRENDATPSISTANSAAKSTVLTDPRGGELREAHLRVFVTAEAENGKDRHVHVTHTPR